MTADRKEVIRSYKFRKVVRAIVAVRCVVTGDVWVASTPNLDTMNGEWFILRQGHHRNKVLQAAWNKYGEQSFQRDVVETPGEEVPDVLVRDLLAQKKQQWIVELGASAL